MFETANPKQPFIVINQINIFPNDEEIMIKLYQPLVGATAIALYQTLIQNFDPFSILSDAKGIYVLQEQLDCSLKNLFVALHKLEATGLIQTFLVNNTINQVLAFKMLKVPSSQDFFGTPLLASLLKEKVGVTTFHELSHNFAKENKQRYKVIKDGQDVSASFLEVFRLPSEEAINPSKDVLEAAGENQIPKVKQAKLNSNDHIDWDFMQQQFEMYQIASSEVIKNKNAILSLMKTYGLSEQEFVDESLPSLHGKNSLDMSNISNLLAENYRSDATRSQINHKIKFDKKSITPTYNLSTDTKKLLADANQLSPAEFLYKIKSNKGGFSSPSEKKILNILRSQYGLPSDLINILIYTCLSYDSVVSNNLAYRIANDWLQHGVVSSFQAIEYLKKRKQKNRVTKNYYSNKKRVEQGTDWSKKKAKANTNVNSNDLKNFFKNLEDQNGMK